MHEMDKYCPEYIAIGDGGGGEVLIMKQERKCNTLIVTSAGNLISQFISPEYCTFFHGFFDGWVARKCPANEIDPITPAMQPKDECLLICAGEMPILADGERFQLLATE